MFLINTRYNTFNTTTGHTTSVTRQGSNITTKGHGLISQQCNDLRNISPPFRPHSNFKHRQDSLLTTQFPTNRRNFSSRRPQGSTIRIIRVQHRYNVKTRVITRRHHGDHRFVCQTMHFSPFINLRGPLTTSREHNPLITHFNMCFRVQGYYFNGLLLGVDECPLLSAIIRQYTTAV